MNELMNERTNRQIKFKPTQFHNLLILTLNASKYELANYACSAASRCNVLTC